MIDSYQKIQQIYNKEVEDILNHYVWVEEKVDGSQFRIHINRHGINVGSHHQELDMDYGMFTLASEMAEKHFKEYVKTLDQAEDNREFTVFCEYLKKPNQNAIMYERVPIDNLVIFDVKMDNLYLSRPEKEYFAYKFALEVVPLLWEGQGRDLTKEMIDNLLKTKSFLGNNKQIEGIVIKAYGSFYDPNKFPNLQGSFLCAKIVNPEFKEMNREANLKKTNELEKLKKNVCTEARWKKGIQSMKEEGIYEGKMSDLKVLIPKIQRDLEQEEKENIKNILWGMYGKEILRASIKGLPEWYAKLLT